MRSEKTEQIRTLSEINADTLGVIASGLCFIHCVLTPLLFVAQTCSATCCSAAPLWWKWVDYFFLIISFIAVYQSTKVTAKNWMKNALWLSWGALLLMILNENITWLVVPKYIVYLPAFALIALHLYNQRYCDCKETTCCSVQN